MHFLFSKKKNIFLRKKNKYILEFIKSLGITNISVDDKTLLPNNDPIDIYLKDYKIAIECLDLEKHNELHKDKKYHLQQLNNCIDAHIRLVDIFEDEWINKKDIICSMIKNLVGMTDNKVYARKCSIEEVPTKAARAFFDRNHVQGYVNSSVNLGLFHNGILVSLMTFGKPRLNMGRKKREEGIWELVRFANRTDTSVVGGASKLFKYFIKNYQPKIITSYSDKRWSEGKMYRILGFEYSHSSEPNYYYVIDKHRENRFKYRKDRLIAAGFDGTKTEHQIMLDRNIYRIYDCGCKVWQFNCSQQ